ncbi:MAG: hypothetical protein PHG66_03020 [Candidatus Colwellbacteria bacterium]|nr:hypothetical protein [Candidatus Colwellbacteria bacterium]
MSEFDLPKELLRLKTVEKLLEDWEPTSDLQRERKKSIQYDIREARMSSEAASGKAGHKAIISAGKIAEFAERKIWETNLR